ncbi:MAG: lysoplasmalogenase [Candidatus Thorarchaeota archaeon]
MLVEGTMIELIYSIIFWVIAIVSSILQHRYPDAGVASYQTVIKVVPTLLAMIFTLYSFSIFSATFFGTFYMILGIALFFCMLGDVAMEKDLVPGIGMFLLAHLIFTVNFLWQAIMLTPNFTNILLTIICFGGFAAYVFMFIRYLKSSGPEVPAFILKAGSFYFILLSATISTSLLLWLTSGSSMGFIPLIGALFFIISDSIIALNEFHHKLSRPELLIMPTYYIAIFLLSLGAMAYLF